MRSVFPEAKRWRVSCLKDWPLSQAPQLFLEIGFQFGDGHN